jgi:hypothetical protein
MAQSTGTPGGTTFGVYGKFGEVGERRTRRILDSLPAGAIVFYDLKIPGSNANVDAVVLIGRNIYFEETKIGRRGTYRSNRAGQVFLNGERYIGQNRKVLAGSATVHSSGASIRVAAIGATGEITIIDDLTLPAAERHVAAINKPMKPCVVDLGDGVRVEIAMTVGDCQKVKYLFEGQTLPMAIDKFRPLLPSNARIRRPLFVVHCDDERYEPNVKRLRPDGIQRPKPKPSTPGILKLVRRLRRRPSAKAMTASQLKAWVARQPDKPADPAIAAVLASYTR